MSANAKDCPCGSGARYRECCGPRHDGTRPAETPEALMRSRWSAFARGLGEYLYDTLSPEAPGARIEEREERERARLLYVGFTRARDHLVLAVRRKGPGKLDTTWLDGLAGADGMPLIRLPDAGAALSLTKDDGATWADAH